MFNDTAIAARLKTLCFKSSYQVTLKSDGTSIQA